MSHIDYDYIHRLNRLIDQYDHVQRLVESARALSVFQDTMAIEAMRQNALDIERIQRLGESARLALSAFQNSAAMESIRQTDALLDRYRRMEEMYGRIAASLPDRSVLESIRQTDTLLDSARLTAIALQESPAMRAIRELLNTPFDPVVREIIFNDLDSREMEQPDITECPDFTIDQNIQSEIQKELAGNRDYNRLSNRAKSILSFIFFFCLLPYFLNILSNLTTPYIQKIVQTDLQKKETLSEIKSYVRKPIPGINKELLKNYRIVIGSDVHLRKGPSMKSEIIAKLPRRKLIKVLDKSNRSWLRIGVDIEGETFVGWVSRRYTAYFR